MQSGGNEQKATYPVEGLDDADKQDDLEGADAEHSLHALQDEPDALCDGGDGPIMGPLLRGLRSDIPGLNATHGHQDPRRKGKARNDEEDDSPPLQANLLLVTLLHFCLSCTWHTTPLFQ